MARRAALVAGLVGLVLLAVLLLVPFATRERTLYGTFPQPQPLFEVSLVVLRGGERACLNEAAVDEHSEVAQIRVGTNGRPTQPLELTLAGDRYRAAAAIPANGWADNDLIGVPVEPPDRTTEVRACLRNAGRGTVFVYGSADRTKTRSTTLVDGRRARANFQLSFVEEEPGSFADRADAILDRVETFRPGFIANWMLWILIGLVVVGMPVSVVLALDRALRDDERRPRDTPREPG